jgi:hypothetical protein
MASPDVDTFPREAGEGAFREQTDFFFILSILPLGKSGAGRGSAYALVPIKVLYL